MTSTDLILGAAEGRLIKQLGSMSNRHGIITGATGTGKTVSLQVLAEGFSKLGHLLVSQSSFLATRHFEISSVCTTFKGYTSS